MKRDIDPESPLGKAIRQNLEFQDARDEAKRLGVWDWTYSPWFTIIASAIIIYLVVKFIAPPVADYVAQLTDPYLPKSEPWKGPERLLGNDGLPIPDEQWPKQ